MPVSSPPPRRKSCGACIKAKRRCDQTSPRCTRCLSKGIMCDYGTAGTTKPRSQMSNGHGLGFERGIMDTDHGEASNIHSAPESSHLEEMSIDSNMHDLWLPPRTMNADPVRIEFITSYFKSLPNKLVDTASLSFMHRKLWENECPQPILDAFAACSAYLGRNSSTSLLVFGLISETVRRIHQYRQTAWSTEHKLASLQALVLLQIVRLWDGNIKQRSLAEQDGDTIFSWAKELHDISREPVTSGSDPSPWRNWLLRENINRTIILAILVQGSFDVEKLEYCQMRPGREFVKSVPFTPILPIWDAQNSYEWERAQSQGNPSWAAGVSLESVLYAYDSKVPLDEFGMMIISLDFGADIQQKWEDESVPLSEIQASSVSATVRTSV